jgi:hypothetical protein
MGIHLAAKRLNVKSLTHPISISPKPYAIRVFKRLPFWTAPAEWEEPLYRAFAFLVVIPKGICCLAFASLVVIPEGDLLF